jgi:hypothetical protein
MDQLEECKEELTELAETIGLSPERVDARAGEIAMLTAARASADLASSQCASCCRSAPSNPPQ